MARIDLNCDMGESFGPYRIGDDETVIASITSANIACGFHASDPTVMDRTVRLCKKYGVMAGAHPGYPDRVGFGRRYLAVDREDLLNDIVYQVGALQGFLARHSLTLQHVKLHGALYNHLAGDEELLLAVARTVRTAFDSPIFLTLGTGRTDAFLERCRREGIRLALEAFPDRMYTDEGFLLPRNRPGAVLEDPEEIARRAVSMARDGIVTTVGGRPLSMSIHTLCLHGDNPQSVAAAARVRGALAEAGIDVVPLSRFL